MPDTAHLTQLHADLAELRAARTRVLSAQSYQVGDGGSARRMDRAALADITAEIRRIERQILAAGGSLAGPGATPARRIHTIVPR